MMIHDNVRVCVRLYVCGFVCVCVIEVNAEVTVLIAVSKHNAAQLQTDPHNIFTKVVVMFCLIGQSSIRSGIGPHY